MTEFHETRMGHEFYGSTMPRLVKALERLNELLERLVAQRTKDDEETDDQHPRRSSEGTR